ncbi:chalcone isomerase family protein [Chitinibacter fontanus]|uniref:Chalcone isomerase family protein n=1 Tax=Chitinibacter fontanus TaxID=1737446 RepID=A0A7D5Z7N5_9NEIS|nr:chalcone isomerase family protein [Chitinibacter fontanus]QLI80065.1 chalcone isomerase family protein [Chitinibacter fontanus]
MPNKLLIAMLVAVLQLGSVGYAAEVEGVKLADQLELAGQTLQLNGAGLRKKMVFDVYVAALYGVNKTSEAQQILSAKSPKRLQLTMLRNVEGKALAEALRDGLQENLSASQFASHVSRIAELEKILLDTKQANKGDVINLDLIAGQGTRIQFRGQVIGSIQSDEFARDLLLIWLGNKPVQDSLKAKLLGR